MSEFAPVLSLPSSRLAKARLLLAKGNDRCWEAMWEIGKAHEEDFHLTNQETADELHRSEAQVRRYRRLYDLYLNRRAVDFVLPDTNFDEAYRTVDKTPAEHLVASTENEWHTPAQYIEAARCVLGEIDLDPASSALANETVQAKRFFTEADMPFVHSWEGRIWLNPPYGGLGGSFVSRLIDEFYGGDVTAAIALVNAHCTDAQWFKPLFNQPLCFTDHRIDFDSAGREKTASSTHGSVFAYFGEDEAAFIREFGIYGSLVRPL